MITATSFCDDTPVYLDFARTRQNEINVFSVIALGDECFSGVNGDELSNLVDSVCKIDVTTNRLLFCKLFDP